MCRGRPGPQRPAEQQEKQNAGKVNKGMRLERDRLSDEGCADDNCQRAELDGDKHPLNAPPESCEVALNRTRRRSPVHVCADVVHQVDAVKL